MDEMNIVSGFMQQLLADIIVSTVNKKMGMDIFLMLKLNDKLKVTVNDDCVDMHINADLSFSKSDFYELLRKSMYNT